MQVGNIASLNNLAYYKKKNPLLTDFAFDIIKDRVSSDLNAKEYLETLSSEEIFQLQKSNSLASRINIHTLSEEGAENLFMSPLRDFMEVDLNDDGITEVGKAMTGLFPPPNAPRSVKEAWASVTDGMSLNDRAHFFMHHIGVQLQANAYEKPDGTLATRKLGDTDWVNAFGTTEESYVELFKDIINRIDHPLAFRDADEKKIDSMVKATYQEAIDIITGKV